MKGLAELAHTSGAGSAAGVWMVPDPEARREDLISRITDLEALS